MVIEFGAYNFGIPNFGMNSMGTSIIYIADFLRDIDLNLILDIDGNKITFVD